MSKRITLFIAIATLVFLVVLGMVGYFYWMSIAYVDTLHARVVGSLVEVSCPSAARVVDLPLEPGDAVAQNERVATLELRGTNTGSIGATNLLVPVRAPITGVVVEEPAQDGDSLSPGQAIVTLVDPQQVWIRANVHETRIARVQVGQPARIYIRAVHRFFPGRVEQIVGTTTSALAGGRSGPDISTPSLIEVPVKISISSGGYTLYPGLSAEVRIGLNPKLW
jgi:multidrug resistance efflux pump